MSVKIRLKRMGRKRAPHYRVVVTDTASPRDGRFVESIGYYKPLSEPARLVLDLERVDYWLGNGATPSNTVKSLIGRAREGGDETVAVGEVDVEARKQEAKEALAAKRAAETAAAKAAEEEAREAEEAARAAAEEAKAAEEAAAAKAEAAEADSEAEADADSDEDADADSGEDADSDDDAESETDASADDDAAESDADADEDAEKKAE